MLLSLVLPLPGPAYAQSCSFTIAPIDFGSMSLLSGAEIDVNTSLRANCSGVAGRTIFVCGHFGAGSGGVQATTAARRYMAGAAAKLDFNLFVYSTRTIIWGSGFWTLQPKPNGRSLTLGPTGTGSTVIPMYGRVFANQQAVPAGAYSSSFTGTDARATYAYDATSCPEVGNSRATSFTLQVAGNVLASCRLSVTAMTFGTASLLRNGMDAQSTISVTCSRGTNFALRLNGGLAAATDPAGRRMVGPSGAHVTYGIYQDVARSRPWGSLETNDLNATATGSPQLFTAFGRVPAQAVRPGTYSDTVLVEVIY